MQAHVRPSLNRLQKGAAAGLRSAASPSLCRAAATSSVTPDGSDPVLVVGARGVNRPSYTETGASGRDATVDTSATLEEAQAKVRALYRGFLRQIPQMRIDFALAEDYNTLKEVIRDQFERNSDIRDPQVLDILIFRGKQELNEIIAQWKSRHHILQYVRQFEERLHQQGRTLAGRKALTADGDVSEAQQAMRLRKVLEWRQKRIIPEWVVSWSHYEKWRSEQERLFQNFALQNGLFTAKELELNRSYQQRTNAAENSAYQCHLM
jgi:NADH dehydrogenase (ubiquinone) 1 alpha subcomplex subunit 6